MEKRIVLFIIFFVSLSYSAILRNSQFSGFKKGYLSFSCSYMPTGASAINSHMEEFGLNELDENMLIWGIELAGNTNPSLGFGVQYFSGYDATNRIVEVEDNTTYIKLDRAVNYNISYFGITLNYRKELKGRFEYFGSASVNYGEIELVISQDKGDQSFGDVWDSFDPERDIYVYNRSVNLASDLYLFFANNGVKFYINDKLAIGFSIGYTYGFVNDSWTINYGFESIKNVPDLDFYGTSYNLVLYYGS